ncbi:hypothetical protein BS639_04190 [Rouxiella silvae]|uniref:Uncharacterized protein n=2 Tax=Rouxiella silvae TaxID=1646373 RepID=A0ABX3U4Y6_9GAMM|nr:hypothetical protein BS639_04190 [Rouxiella silvae]
MIFPSVKSQNSPRKPLMGGDYYSCKPWEKASTRFLLRKIGVGFACFKQEAEMSDENLIQRIDQLERVNRELLVQVSAMRILFGSVGNTMNTKFENSFTSGVKTFVEREKDALNASEIEDASKKFRTDVLNCVSSLLPTVL